MLGLSYANRLSPRIESDLQPYSPPPPLGSDTPVILTESEVSALVKAELKGAGSSSLGLTPHFVSTSEEYT